MLSEICKELNNWFTADADKHFGSFSISDGVITPSDFLKNGQYYRIVGSVSNDSVFKFGDTDNVPTDEDFEGAVWAMRVPPDVIRLSEEIDAWNKKYAEIAASPFMSETYFTDYSYQKNAAVGGTQNVSTWQFAFAGRLNQWRKL